MRLQPWQTVALPFGVWAFTAFLLAFIKDDGHWAIWAVPAIIILAILYVLSPQLNWWWYSRNPPPLSMVASNLLDEHFAYYKKLSPELKTIFRERVALFIVGQEFIRPVRSDDSDAQSMRNLVPENLKAGVAAVATQVFFGKKNTSVGKFEHYILYPHPFPTPQYQHLHTSEIYDEDGVVLFDSDTLMTGMSNPEGFFSIGIYEFSKILKKINPSVSTPILGENDWFLLEKISGMSRDNISGIVGLYELDDFGILAHHFFTFPERFKSVLPDLYQLLSNIFQQNPYDTTQPVTIEKN